MPQGILVLNTDLKVDRPMYCNDPNTESTLLATATGSLSLHVYAPGWVAVSLYREVHGEVDAGGAPIDVDAWGDF